jgi:hypothetical protein
MKKEKKAKKIFLCVGGCRKRHETLKNVKEDYFLKMEIKNRVC